MENQKTNILFCTAVIVFLAVDIILIKDFNARRVSDFKGYATSVTGIIKRDNDKFKLLYGQIIDQQKQLIAQQKENNDLRYTLAETKNDLDSLTKKLAEPVPVAAPASVPAPAAATAAVAAPTTK